MQNKELIDLFLNTYRVNNKSINTINAYRRVLIDFDNFLAKDFNQLSLLDIDKYKLYKSDKSPATQNQAIMCLRVFTKFLYKRGVLEKNISPDIERIQTGNKLSNRQYMKEEHQRIFIDFLLQMSESRSWRKRRDSLMFLLYISTGVRKTELINIKVSDIKQLENGDVTILIHGKGNKERYVWINEKVRVMLEKFITRSKYSGDDYIFVTAHGNRVHPHNVNKTLDTILTYAGLPHYTVHDLRHACASMMFESGATKEEVQMALGHSNIATTENIYIHYTDAKQISGFKMNKLFNPQN